MEAQAGLDSETKKIVTDNRRMGEELRFQLQMMAELQAEKARTEELVRRLQQSVALLTEKEKEYAKQGQVRTNENKKLRCAQSIAPPPTPLLTPSLRSLRSHARFAATR